MEAVTLLLGAALFIIAVLFLLPADKRKAKIARLVNKLHGPTQYPIFGTALPFLFIKRNETFKYITENHNTFRPIFRSWNGSVPNIHLLRPEDVEVILKSSDHLEKGHFYRLLHPWLGTGLLTSTGQKWHTHRKMITPTFHFSILDSFVEVFSDKSEILVSKLQKEVGSQGFNIYPYITKCALDIICETAMGTSTHAQDERGSDYVKAVYDLSEIIVNRIFRPWLHYDFIFRLSALGKRSDQCLGVLHGFTNKVIQERKALLSNVSSKPSFPQTEEDISISGRKRRKAFLDLLLEASNDGIRLTDEELREEVDTFMFEGHDTTSAGMCWALFLLGLHPDVQDKAYQEQESIFQGSDRTVTMKDLSEMKYLERVIKESLRLYPSV
ncbi:Cytochrome P450 4C1, partial [Cryptotermes secundus]